MVFENTILIMPGRLVSLLHSNAKHSQAGKRRLAAILGVESHGICIA
jgi:hypothetical protein